MQIFALELLDVIQSDKRKFLLSFFYFKLHVHTDNFTHFSIVQRTRAVDSIFSDIGNAGVCRQVDGTTFSHNEPLGISSLLLSLEACRINVSSIHPCDKSKVTWCLSTQYHCTIPKVTLI